MKSYTEFIAAAMARIMKGNATDKDREDVRGWVAGQRELRPGGEEEQGDVFLAETYRRFLESETKARGEVWEVVAGRLREQEENRFRRKRYLRLAAAACLILIVSGLWLAGVTGGKRSGEQAPAALAVVQAPIAPARQGAILRLADGSEVLLDSTGGGLLGSQGKVSVVKSGKGELKYLDAGTPKDSKPVWNTLSTPKGKQFRIELPDGTRVWLNAESSLEYPVAFNGGRREVKLKGEAYFEVAQNKEKPFFVHIANTAAGAEEQMSIQVLGTSFDAMAYSDEGEVQTTLVEGAVRVSMGGRSAGVRPGEAATIGWNAGDRIVVQKVDIEKAVAWKNGMFHYTQTPLSVIMRDIARWYDVDVRYDGALPDMKFDGSISRNNSLDKILQILAINQVHFRMEGRTIVVAK